MLATDRLELYITLIKDSQSFCEVCRRAGIKSTNGNYTTLKNIVDKYDIDISHFKRISLHSVKKHNLSDVLENKVPMQSYKLKNRLLSAGLKEAKCERCSNSEWQGYPIALQLHHIDGNPNNNNLSNLHLLCPNCHAMTDNYCGKNQNNGIRIARKKRIDKKELYRERINSIQEAINFCQNLKEVSNLTAIPYKQVLKICRENNLSCIKKITQSEKMTVSPEELQNLISQFPMTTIAQRFGVSDTAVRKWCKKFHIQVKR